jgi:mono/diheme cytochrome c family protein
MASAGMNPSGLLLPLLLGALGLRAGAVSASFETRSGRDLYQASCAACHGSGGDGASPSGTPLPRPDFRDCSFASREPDGDWGVIIQ